MPARTDAAADAARRLWSRTTEGVRSPEESTAAAAQLCRVLSVSLGRWIGVEGYRALLGRALDIARVEHPVLDGVACREDGARLTTPAFAAAPAEVAAGMEVLLAAMIDLLGRIIGDALAVRLIERSADGLGGGSDQAERGRA